MTDSVLSEIQDRCRRIETRLSRFMEKQGVDVQGEKPVLIDEEIRVPSADCSLRACLAVIPESVKYDVLPVVTPDGVTLAYLGRGDM